jgi:type IX secretion system substrate protein
MRKMLIFLLSFLGSGEFVQAQESDLPNEIIHPPVYGIENDMVFENDGGVSSINSVPMYQCTATISPSVEIVNYGSNVLTNALLDYFIDSDAPALYSWQGSLEPGGVDTIQFDPIQVTAGSHVLTVSIVTANGSLDINGGNNDGLVDFYIVGTSASIPVSETFNAGVIPNGYFVENSDGGPTWAIYEKNSAGGPDYTMQMHFYYSNAGNIDQFYLKNIDLSNTTQALMTFDLAYKYYKNSVAEYSDELKVLASSDCGNYWNVIYDKTKDDLATLPPDDVEFFPNDATQWRTESVNLNNYSGNSNVMLRFEAISGHGNNLYIDNLNISSVTGIDEVNKQPGSLQIFPNPANDFIRIQLNRDNNDQYTLLVNNIIGQNIQSSHFFSATPLTMNISRWPEGVYLIKVLDGTNVIGTEKLDVIH